MGMKGAPATLSDDDVVLKSPNDRRLYRLIHLPNGLRALLVHDPEIYPEGPPKHVSNEDEVEEEDDDDEEEDEDEEEEEEDEDDDDDDEEEEEGNEMDGVKGGAAAAQSKKVGFLFVFFCVVHFCWMPISILALFCNVLLLWLCG